MTKDDVYDLTGDAVCFRVMSIKLCGKEPVTELLLAIEYTQRT